MRGHFAWEYKGKHKDLAAAYQQLLLYREDLENCRSWSSTTPDRFVVHTNFTGTVKRGYPFRLADLTAPSNLDVLRRLLIEPNSLRPDQTTARVTEQASELFMTVPEGMGRRLGCRGRVHDDQLRSLDSILALDHNDPAIR